MGCKCSRTRIGSDESQNQIILRKPVACQTSEQGKAEPETVSQQRSAADVTKQCAFGSACSETSTRTPRRAGAQRSRTHSVADPSRSGTGELLDHINEGSGAAVQNSGLRVASNSSVNEQSHSHVFRSGGVSGGSVESNSSGSEEGDGHERVSIKNAPNSSGSDIGKASFENATKPTPPEDASEYHVRDPSGGRFARQRSSTPRSRTSATSRCAGEAGAGGAGGAGGGHVSADAAAAAASGGGALRAAAAYSVRPWLSADGAEASSDSNRFSRFAGGAAAPAAQRNAAAAAAAPVPHLSAGDAAAAATVAGSERSAPGWRPDPPLAPAPAKEPVRTPRSLESTSSSTSSSSPPSHPFLGEGRSPPAKRQRSDRDGGSGGRRRLSHSISSSLSSAFPRGENEETDPEIPAYDAVPARMPSVDNAAELPTLPPPLEATRPPCAIAKTSSSSGGELAVPFGWAAAGSAAAAPGGGPGAVHGSEAAAGGTAASRSGLRVDETELIRLYAEKMFQGGYEHMPFLANQFERYRELLKRQLEMVPLEVKEKGKKVDTAAAVSEIILESSVIVGGRGQVLMAPWVESDPDIKHNFYLGMHEVSGLSSAAPPPRYTDPDGRIYLSGRQRQRFHGWERISTLMADRWSSACIFDEAAGPRSDHIRQGFVGDCSLLSSLAVLADYERIFREPVISSVLYPRVYRNPGNSPPLHKRAIGEAPAWETGGRAPPGEAAQPPSAGGGVRFPYTPVVNSYGMYACKLYFNGVPRKVVLDDYIPVRREKRLLCAHSANPNEFWVPLLEKGFVKMMGGSYSIQGSNPGADLYHLTGWIPETISFRSDVHPGAPETHQPIVTGAMAYEALHDAKWDALWAQLRAGVPRGACVVCLGTSDIIDAAPSGMAEHPEGVSRSNGIVARHAYSVLRLADRPEGRLLFVKNPWCCVRWRGRFSPTDRASWTAELQRALRYDREAHASADDGCFWIDWLDVVQWFSHLYLCWNPRFFRFSALEHAKWACSDLAARSIMKDDATIVAYNPQFHLHVGDIGGGVPGAGSSGGGYGAGLSYYTGGDEGPGASNFHNAPSSFHEAGFPGARSADGAAGSVPRVVDVWVLLSRHVRERKRDLSQKYLALHLHAGRERILCPPTPLRQGVYSNGECALVKLRVDLGAAGGALTDRLGGSGPKQRKRASASTDGDGGGAAAAAAEFEPQVFAERDFVLVISQYSQREEFNFSIQVHSQAPLRLTPLRPLVSPGEGWQSAYRRGAWRENTAGGCSNDLWGYFQNPQTRLSLSQHSALVLFLETSGEVSVNLRVFLAAVATPRFLRAGKVVSSGSYRAGSCVVRCELPPGDYTLVASTFRMGEVADFQICVHARPIGGDAAGAAGAAGVAGDAAGAAGAAGGAAGSASLSADSSAAASAPLLLLRPLPSPFPRPPVEPCFFHCRHALPGGPGGLFGGVVRITVLERTDLAVRLVVNLRLAALLPSMVLMANADDPAAAAAAGGGGGGGSSFSSSTAARGSPSGPGAHPRWRPLVFSDLEGGMWHAQRPLSSASLEFLRRQKINTLSCVSLSPWPSGRPRDYLLVVSPGFLCRESRSGGEWTPERVGRLGHPACPFSPAEARGTAVAHFIASAEIRLEDGRM